MQIGMLLRSVRLEKGLTLRDLSSMTGLSTGFLSNVERDINSPTISSLTKICQALNTTLVALLEDTSLAEKRVIRKHEREVLFSSKMSKAVYKALSSRDKRLRAICIEMEPGGDYGEVPLGHPGDEFGIVLQGSMEITVGGDPYMLQEGDSFYIDAFVPHKFRNTGQERSISLWVLESPVENLPKG